LNTGFQFVRYSNGSGIQVFGIQIPIAYTFLFAFLFLHNVKICVFSLTRDVSFANTPLPDDSAAAEEECRIKKQNLDEDGRTEAENRFFKIRRLVTNLWVTRAVTVHSPGPSHGGGGRCSVGNTLHNSEKHDYIFCKNSCDVIIQSPSETGLVRYSDG
jgi:hypothetical protein